MAVSADFNMLMAFYSETVLKGSTLCGGWLARFRTHLDPQHGKRKQRQQIQVIKLVQQSH